MGRGVRGEGRGHRRSVVAALIFLAVAGHAGSSFAATGSGLPEACGNGACDAGETKQSCPQDCRPLLRLLRQRREREERPRQPAGRHGAEALGPGDAQESLTVQGRARTYLLHAPPSYDGAGAMPLVLVFHGGYGTGAIASRMSDLSGYADREGFLAVYPDGIERSWNDGRGTTAADQQGIDDVGFVAALIDHLARRFVIDRSRVYAAGMSNGAIFAFRLGCELSDRLTAIAAVSGAMAEAIVPSCAPSAPLSVLVLKGTADPLTPYEGGETRKGQGGRVLSAPETAEHWAKHNGCRGPATTEVLPPAVDDGTTVERTTHTGCLDGSGVILYTVKGMGHAWPPAEPHVPRVSGRTSRNIDATSVIWAFFKSHSKTL